MVVRITECLYCIGYYFKLLDFVLCSLSYSPYLHFLSLVATASDIVGKRPLRIDVVRVAVNINICKMNLFMDCLDSVWSMGILLAGH